MKKAITISLLAVLFLSGFSVSARADSPLLKGEAIYNKHCSVCHGEKGVGTDTGSPLVHKIYHPNHHADFSFHLAVKTGVKAHHWKFGNMPAMKWVGKKDTDMIIKYVRDLQKAAGIF